MSKKYRKYAVTNEYQEHIRSAIALNIKNHEPIKITLIFGGYKLWRLEESPEVDWAELFSMIYYSSWIKPIADNYAPGVWFDFYSDDVIVETIDNISRADIDAYLNSFRNLLEFITQYLPQNIKLTLNRVADQYASLAQFEEELNDKLKDITISELSPSQLATLELNVKPLPGQTPNWPEIQRMHDAYMTVSKRRPYYRTPDKISAITKQSPNAIAVGTTKTSVVKFWIGVGALQKISQGFIETVLSPSALNKKYAWEPIGLAGLTGKNFHQIRICTVE